MHFFSRTLVPQVPKFPQIALKDTDYWMDFAALEILQYSQLTGIVALFQHEHMIRSSWIDYDFQTREMTNCAEEEVWQRSELMSDMWK